MQKRILVIDDEPMVARVIARLLSRDHAVTAVHSAHDALALISAGEHFDAIVCDLAMPEMDGSELYQHLVRTAPELAAAMIFVSGGANTPALQRFHDDPPTVLVAKPFDPATLLALVNRVLACPSLPRR